MKKLFLLIMVLSIIGCNHYIHVYKHGSTITDTIVLTDTIIRLDTLTIVETITDTFTIIQEVLTMPLNPYPGMIISMDNFHSDSLHRVWVQWGEFGPWHQYILQDTTKANISPK